MSNTGRDLVIQPKKIRRDHVHFKPGVGNASCPAMGRGVIKTGRDFCLETSMHGFNHIATPRRHWLERLLWFGIIVCFIWGAINISLGQWKRYKENPTVVTLEKDFRSWSFSLPGITACSENKTNTKKVKSVIKKLWNAEPSDEKYTYYSEFIDTVANYDIFHDKSGGNPFQKYANDHSLDVVDLFQLVVDVAPPENIKVTLFSKGHVSSWIPVMTESGVCHTTNSLAVADIALKKINPNYTKDYPLKCKYTDACYIVFESSSNMNFNYHSPFDVADLLTPSDVIKVAQQKSDILSVLETRCGAGVEELSVSRRRCLAVDEPTDGKKQVYSTNMCRRTCRNNLALKMCGCKPFYYFYEDGPPCTPAGLACLVDHVQSLVNPKCPCMLQCVDAFFKEVSTSEQRLMGPMAVKGSIRYTVQAPRDRYTREIVFHFQDLVVSFGGAAGLFLGASFLSFVEIFFFLTKRFFRTCVKQPLNDVQVIGSKKKIPYVSYETAKIKELTNILENKRNNERKMRLLY